MDTRKGITLGRDAAGNHTSNGLGQTYAWDGHGHLSQFSLNGVQKATYFYNYQHQRTHKNLWNGSTALGTTVYHYDLQGRLLRETSSTGAVLATYIYDEAGTPLAIIQAANSPYNATAQDQVVYLHTGHLGTPRMATDSNRRIVWKWESDAFGSTVPQQDPYGDGKQTIVNLRFPGQYYDAESGLHQNWHRTYDPSLGRYISGDPIGLAGGVNTYGYVANELINWSGSLGLEKLILFPQKTPEYLAAQSVPDTPGLLTVYTHGNESVVSSTPEATNKMDSKALKEKIINDANYTDGMPIQLMSCNAGSGDHPIAEQLANLMDTPTSVSGYDGYVVYLSKTPLNSAIVSPFPWAPNNSCKK